MAAPEGVLEQEVSDLEVVVSFHSASYTFLFYDCILSYNFMKEINNWKFLH